MSLMSEEVAKTKWCPMARVMNIQGQGGGNRWDGSGAPMDGPTNCQCIASKCMMWQLTEEFIIVSEPDVVPVVRANAGYCGLVNK